jgi:hypothetical protein
MSLMADNASPSVRVDIGDMPIYTTSIHWGHSWGVVTGSASDPDTALEHMRAVAWQRAKAMVRQFQLGWQGPPSKVDFVWTFSVAGVHLAAGPVAMNPGDPTWIAYGTLMSSTDAPGPPHIVAQRMREARAM